MIGLRVLYICETTVKLHLQAVIVLKRAEDVSLDQPEKRNPDD